MDETSFKRSSPPISRTRTRSKSPSHSKTKSKSKSPKDESKSPSKSPKDESELEPSFKLKSASKSKSKSPKDELSISISIQDIDLKMPDILPGELNYSEKIAKKMEKLFQMHKDVQPFIGCFYFTNLFYLYLFKKYKMNCVITNDVAGIALTFDFKKNENIEDHYENIENCSQQIFDCITRRHKIVIIPLMFQIMVGDKQLGGHANLLIYRITTGELEHFEPHGAEYGGIQKKMINKRIKAVLLKLADLTNDKIKDYNAEFNESDSNSSRSTRSTRSTSSTRSSRSTRSTSSDTLDRRKIIEITLIPAHHVCPVVEGGLQALEQTSMIPKNAVLEPGGYCTSWSMFFAELCLKNPELSSRQIHDAIMEKTELYEAKNDYLRNVIRGYTCFINNKIAKHFSHVFGEPITSVKIHSLLSEFSKTGEKNEEFTNYIDKFFEIMEVEMDVIINKTNSFPDVKDRFEEFSEGIGSETSSSSLKSEGRESPKRVSNESVTTIAVAKGKLIKKTMNKRNKRTKNNKKNKRRTMNQKMNQKMKN